MFHYKRLFLGLLAMVFLAISYQSSSDFFQILIPITTIIICCGVVGACVESKFCGLFFFLILSVIVCPLLISGRDMHQAKNDPETFDTRTGAFVSDVSYSIEKVVEIVTYVRTRKPISLKIKEDNKYPNYYPVTLCAVAPFGVFGILLRGKKKNEGKKRK